METTQEYGCAARPAVDELADGAVEVFAEDDVILVVIHAGRYQITIEVG
jgi:hypothetical protein